MTVDREAVITIRIRNSSGAEISTQAVIDTGFSEYLSLPPSIIDQLSLPFDAAVPVFLAGDVPAAFDGHTGSVEWDGEWREIQILKADGIPLIGMAMLKGFHLTLDGVDGGPVTIERL